jgi:drug/metabolite transporter (DMT)-like permease
MIQKNQRKAYVFAISAVLAWSTVASAFKVSLRHIDPYRLLSVAALTSCVVIFLGIVAQGKLNLLRETSNSDLRRSALMGFLNPFLYYVVLFKAYDRLPAQEAQPLNYSWAVVLVLLSIPLLGQRISRLSVTGIAISFFGVFVIATRGDVLGFRVSDPIGAGLAVGSSVIWALFWIYNDKDQRDDSIKLLVNFGFGAIYVLIATCFTSSFRSLSAKGVIAAIYVGVFEMGVTFIFWSRAIALSTNTAKVSRFIFLSPFISLVLIHYVLGEDIHVSTVVGLAFIVAGILVEQRGHSRAGVTT